MFDLRYHHVGPEELYESNGIAAVSALPHHLHVIPARGEQGRYALPEHGVVVRQDDSHGGHLDPSSTLSKASSTCLTRKSRTDREYPSAFISAVRLLSERTSEI